MLNPNIILAGQAPDIVNALANSNVAAQQRVEFDRTNAMNRMLQEQGAGIISGDQNALNALAGYDPMAALGVQDARLGMDATRLNMDATRQQMSISAERLAMEKAEGKRMAEAALSAQAAQMTADQLAAEQKQITDALSGAASFYQKGDRAGYDAWLAKLGLDPREYAFDEFPAHAAMFEGVLEVMQSFAPPAPLSSEGKLAADIAAGLVPEGTTKTPETVINMGEGDKFYETLDKGQAEMFQTLMTEGVQAGRTLGLVDRLDQLMQQTPTGGMAALTKLAGEVGIDIGGLGDVQAVQALINQIVPQQRQPGSGPMSDADLALFKQSVPRLINQPGGNQVIIETMRGINQYVLQQSQIAEMVANREITPAEGRMRLRALKNPLDGFKAATGETPAPASTGAPKRTVIDGYTIEAIE